MKAVERASIQAHTLAETIRKSTRSICPIATISVATSILTYIVAVAVVVINTVLMEYPLLFWGVLLAWAVMAFPLVRALQGRGSISMMHLTTITPKWAKVPKVQVVHLVLPLLSSIYPLTTLFLTIPYPLLPLSHTRWATDISAPSWNWTRNQWRPTVLMSITSTVQTASIWTTKTHSTCWTRC